MQGLGLVAELSAKQSICMRAGGNTGRCVEANLPGRPGGDLAHQQDVVTARNISDLFKASCLIECATAVAQVTARAGQRESNTRAASPQSRNNECLQGQQGLDDAGFRDERRVSEDHPDIGFKGTGRRIDPTGWGATVRIGRQDQFACSSTNPDVEGVLLWTEVMRPSDTEDPKTREAAYPATGACDRVIGGSVVDDHDLHPVGGVVLGCEGGKAGIDGF